MPPEPANPATSDSSELRRAMGSFATGITVVTCCDAKGRPCGITANSFSSVSLEPPLVLWNIARASNSLEAFLNADQFVINVLAEHQRAVAQHFAQSDHQLFDQIDFEPGPAGTPLLPETLGRFECSTHHIYEGGDHYIIVGKVNRYRYASGAPLLFYGGRYAALAKT
jgi:flavin reductase (DIM6/NTAB) family NADH-FMN oxidoreductase RutF